MKLTSTYIICILIASFLSGNQLLYGQTLSIDGIILNNQDSTPIEGAVIILNGIAQTTSSQNGKFNFKKITPNLHELSVLILGYSNFRQKIDCSSDTTITIFLIPSVINLGEVEVVSTNATYSTSTIQMLDYLLRPVNTSQELLTLVPGLFVAQHAGGGKAEQLFLRGFDSDHGTDFNISVDGMPVNMVSHAHGHGYADFHFVIPETIDKLKVHKGPYKAKFGDFSTSGTGEFFTKNSINKNEIKIEAGMFDSYRVMGMMNLKDEKKNFIGKNSNAYLAGEYVFTNSYFNQEQNFHRYNLFGKYSRILNKHNFLNVSASTFYADWDASGQIPERAVETIGLYGSIDPSEGGTTRRTNFNVTNTTTTYKESVIKNQLYFVNYYFNLFSNFTFFLNNPVNGDGIVQTDKRNIFGYLGSYQKEYLVGNKIIMMDAGLGTRNDFADITLNHAEMRIIYDTIVNGHVNQQNSHMYYDLVINLTNKFSVNPGIRYDYFIFQFNDKIHNSLSGSKDIGRFSPKLNFNYNRNENVRLYIKSGIGFHSNDARSVVVNNVENNLPKAYGYESGSEFKLTKNILINVALWSLYLQSELVYVGDEGTVETNNPTQRYGVDFSLRYQLSDNLFADIDLNYNYGRLKGVPDGLNYIPLAPDLTSTGGLTYKKEKGFNSSLRYKYLKSRPANEDYSVVAKGYFLLDATIAYRFTKWECGVSVENLMNVKWNQAQFDTESRLFNETESVSELHFTPGTPRYLKTVVTYKF